MVKVRIIPVAWWAAVLLILSHPASLVNGAQRTVRFASEASSETNQNIVDALSYRNKTSVSYGTAPAMILNRYISAGQLARCRSTLKVADSPSNGKLYSNEFAAFITYSSNGLLDKQFTKLPLQLVSLFYSVACQQCFAETKDDFCCNGENAFIDIQQDSNYDSMTSYLCSTVNLIFGDVLKYTSSPVRSPTKPRTPKPKSMPTSRPVMSPTPPQNSVCITFYYTISNTVGLTASDIFNEKGNQLRTGLEIATATIVTEILNSTFPTSSSVQSVSWDKVFGYSSTQATYTPVGNYYGASFAMDVALSEMLGAENSKSVLDSFLVSLYNPPAAYRNGDRRQLQDEIIVRKSNTARSLVYYSESNPAKIVNVINDPFCPQSGNVDRNCAIVVTNVCVTLEAGDNAALVKSTLTNGIRASVDSGAFFDAIPSQYIPKANN